MLFVRLRPLERLTPSREAGATVLLAAWFQSCERPERPTVMEGEPVPVALKVKGARVKTSDAPLPEPSVVSNRVLPERVTGAFAGRPVRLMLRTPRPVCVSEVTPARLTGPNRFTVSLGLATSTVTAPEGTVQEPLRVSVELPVAFVLLKRREPPSNTRLFTRVRLCPLSTNRAEPAPTTSVPLPTGPVKGAKEERPFPAV